MVVNMKGINVYCTCTYSVSQDLGLHSRPEEEGTAGNCHSAKRCRLTSTEGGLRNDQNSKTSDDVDNSLLSCATDRPNDDEVVQILSR